MSTMQSEVFEAFRSLDIPEDKALKAAQALSKRDEDVNSIKSDIVIIKWMLGFLIALIAPMFVRLMLHIGG